MTTSRVATDLSQDCDAAVIELAGRVSRRGKGALVRNEFVRSNDGVVPRLAELAKTRGRGAEVPLKLYLGLMWLSSKAPYNSDFPANSCARVLDLPDPERNGARRIQNAAARLASDDLKLITLKPRAGRTSEIVLLREDGSGEPYSIPKGRFDPAKQRQDTYFNVPPMLWSSGHMQNMSAAALVMLLIVLEESRGAAGPQWWSVDTFRKRFHINKDVRAKGTKELSQRQLVTVGREKVGDWPGHQGVLNPRKVRNTYQLINEAIGQKPDILSKHMLAYLQAESQDGAASANRSQEIGERVAGPTIA